MLALLPFRVEAEKGFPLVRHHLRSVRRTKIMRYNGAAPDLERGIMARRRQFVNHQYLLSCRALL
jgi:hypothetical protein